MKTMFVLTAWAAAFAIGYYTAPARKADRRVDANPASPPLPHLIAGVFDPELPLGNNRSPRPLAETVGGWTDNKMLVWNASDGYTVISGVKISKAPSGIVHMVLYKHGVTTSLGYDPEVHTMEEAIAACEKKVEQLRIDR